jgi:hypothetical protein
LKENKKNVIFIFMCICSYSIFPGTVLCGHIVAFCNCFVDTPKNMVHDGNRAEGVRKNFIN